jgi:hypothetical protein
MSFELGRGHGTTGMQGRESATSRHAFTNGGQDQQAVWRLQKRHTHPRTHPRAFKRVLKLETVQLLSTKGPA